MVSNDFVKLWAKLSKEMKSHMELHLAPTLTEGQLQVLELLESNGKMKPSDLLEHLETTPAAVTTLLDRMEKGELIIRERDEKDRRIVWISATDKGVSECARGIAVRNQFLDIYLNRISNHNQQLLVFLLRKVSTAS